MDGSLNHDIIRSMSAKAFELEAQLVSLQMTLRTQNDLISVFVRNMEEEINVATYRAKSELESASLHLKLEQEKVSSVYDSAKERLSYVAKSVFLPVFRDYLRLLLLLVDVKSILAGVHKPVYANRGA